MCFDSELDLYIPTVPRILSCSFKKINCNIIDYCNHFTLNYFSGPECGDIRDLDMCRDRELVAGNWRCPVCNVVYNKDEIEMRLVEVLQRRSTSYQVKHRSFISIERNNPFLFVHFRKRESLE